ncbi:flagellar protein FlgN [bacterium]|nr:flagellar protein FlgN [bacterium]
MGELFPDLIQTLKAELALYREVAQFVASEREALAGRDPLAVLDLVRRKETVLLRIRTLDETRQIICRRVARVSGASAEEMTLEGIQKACDPEMAGVLADLRGELRDCLDGLRRMNDQNSHICRQGLESVRLIMQAVSEAPAKESVAGYGSKSRGGRASAPSRHWTT